MAIIAGANGDKLRKDYDGVFLTAMLLNAIVKYRYAIASNMAISEFRGGAERRNQNPEGVGCATIRPARLEDTCGPDSLPSIQEGAFTVHPRNDAYVLWRPMWGIYSAKSGGHIRDPRIYSSVLIHRRCAGYMICGTLSPMVDKMVRTNQTPGYLRARRNHG